MRIDKYIWSVRIYKTRSKATEACRKGRVLIDGEAVKAARTLQEGDVFEVRKNPVTYKYRVKALLPSRVGAKLVPDYLEDITPEEELWKLEATKISPYAKRERGSGRPTKKERRDMERFREAD